MNCPMCGAPRCPNDPDGDGVGNWDVFDGFIIKDAAEFSLLERALALLRRAADGAFSATDPDEQGAYSRRLEDEASAILDELGSGFSEVP
jgi:hypothetical protein